MVGEPIMYFYVLCMRLGLHESESENGWRDSGRGLIMAGTDVCRGRETLPLSQYRLYKVSMTPE